MELKEFLEQTITECTNAGGSEVDQLVDNVKKSFAEYLMANFSSQIEPFIIKADPQAVILAEVTKKCLSEIEYDKYCLKERGQVLFEPERDNDNYNLGRIESLKEILKILGSK